MTPTLEATPPVPTALYRLYGTRDVVLYIGITAEPTERFAQHAALQTWWSEVVDRAVEWYPDRKSAAAAESAAIRTERPVYNLSGVHPRLRPAPTTGPELPAWPPEALGSIAAQLGELLGRRDVSHAHARLRALNLLLRGRDELPHGSELRTLAGFCGMSLREAYRALQYERGSWPEGWEADAS